LHVLATPPAFVLSQDQTLQELALSSAVSRPRQMSLKFLKKALRTLLRADQLLYVTHRHGRPGWIYGPTTPIPQGVQSRHTLAASSTVHLSNTICTPSLARSSIVPDIRRLARPADEKLTNIFSGRRQLRNYAFYDARAAHYRTTTRPATTIGAAHRARRFEFRPRMALLHWT
jgi:hypothetical protein